MDENILANIVRVGTVSSVDAGARKARVLFPDTGITSGWLLVIQHYAAGIYVDPDYRHAHGGTVSDEPNHTHSAPVPIDPAGGHTHTIDEQPDHDHPGTHLTFWMPKVGEKVLTLYVPVYNGDGFILGGI